MIIDELGELAIGLRLKRLYEVFAHSVLQVYKDHQLNFEPKYFGLFYIISCYHEVSVSVIAEELGLTHAGVIHLAKELESLGFINSIKSSTDSRKRILKLSDEGMAALPAFERVWANLKTLNQQLFNSTANNLMLAINETEAALKSQSYNQRYNEAFDNKHIEHIQVIDYDPTLAKYFKLLNIEWINTYFTVEEHDLEQLDNPEESVLKDGGAILFVQYQKDIAGTCALIKTGESEYELAKMAVSPQYRGKYLGNALMEAAIDKAKDMGAKKLWLGSNKRLVPALNLYKKFGFKNVPLKPSPYSRADVRMELIF